MPSDSQRWQLSSSAAPHSLFSSYTLNPICNFCRWLLSHLHSECNHLLLRHLARVPRASRQDIIPGALQTLMCGIYSGSTPIVLCCFKATEIVLSVTPLCGPCASTSSRLPYNINILGHSSPLLAVGRVMLHALEMQQILHRWQVLKIFIRDSILLLAVSHAILQLTIPSRCICQTHGECDGQIT